MSGLLLRNFETRDLELMMKMFKCTYKKQNKILQSDMESMEKGQKNFTSKIK